MLRKIIILLSQLTLFTVCLANDNQKEILDYFPLSAQSRQGFLKAVQMGSHIEYPIVNYLIGLGEKSIYQISLSDKSDKKDVSYFRITGQGSFGGFFCLKILEFQKQKPTCQVTYYCGKNKIISKNLKFKPYIIIALFKNASLYSMPQAKPKKIGSEVHFSDTGHYAIEYYDNGVYRQIEYGEYKDNIPLAYLLAESTVLIANLLGSEPPP